MTNINNSCAAAVFFLLLALQSCATYTPAPLVDAMPRPSDAATLRLRANAIHHPILKAIEFDIDDGLSPDEAAILAVIANPKLRASRDQRKIVAAQLLQAGVLPNPQLSYGLDVPTAGMTQGTVNGFNAGLNWEITSLISRNAKLASAKADVAAVDLDLAWQEWQSAQAAKMQVYHLYYFEQQLNIARGEVEDLRADLDRIRRGAELGLVTVVDRSAAEAALQRITATVLATEQQQEDDRLALNQSLGFPADEILPLEKNIAPADLITLPSVAELTNGVEERRLDLLALKSGYQSQEEKLRATVLSQFPKIAIGFSHAGDTSNVITTGFGITVDLPLFDRNQGAIALEDATRAKLFDEYALRLFEARGEIARLVADLSLLKRQIDGAEQSIPILENVVNAYREALLRGNADILTYYAARSEWVTKRLELVELKRQLADMNVGLEIAAGRYLATAGKGT